jgi:hypothetical protein
MLRSGVRYRRALIAGLLAGAAAAPSVEADPQAVPAGGATAPPSRDDLRDVFGLPRAQPAAPADCGDGLALACAIATDPLDDATPYALSTWLPSSYLVRLPVADAMHDEVAWYALGASRDEAGPAFGGATGLENRWTIDGAPADGVRIGGADTRVPLAFLRGIAVSAGGFSARDRASTGGTIDARLVRGTAHHEIATDAWLSLVRAPSELPIASGSFTVRRLSLDAAPRATASLVATGPLDAVGARLGGAAWYAAGIAPRLTRSGRSWRAVRQLDANSDGTPDGAPGDLAVAPVETTSAHPLDALVPAMARAGLDRGAHHVELSLVGDVERDARFLANATLPAAGIDRTTWVGDAIATWRGTWAQTHARVQLAWHRSSRHETARDGTAADVPQLVTAYVPVRLADDRPLEALCDDTSPGDPTPLITNCPVSSGLFASGGAGARVDAVGDRPSASADVTTRIGKNVMRFGATLEDTRLVTTSSFTGGELQGSLLPGELQHHRFYAGDCSDDPAGPCGYASSSRLTYRTVYAAAYAENTYSPTDGLAINDGLRWELLWVGSRLRFSNQLAPRFGVAWDALGGGRSRLWASVGRTFAMLPAGLGATVLARDATVDDVELGGMRARVHDTGGPFAVAAGAEPVEQDEVTLGAEIALVGALRATVWAQGRYLRHGLETTGGVFGNPGEHGGTTGADGAGADIRATRETELVAASIELLQRATAIRAGVIWGRTVGTWTGPFDPRVGATLLQGPAWDASASNLDGPLPTDLGSGAFVEAERTGTLAGIAVAVATRLTVGSGRPRNVLADGVGGVEELLPRGSAGRNSLVAQADLRLAAVWRGLSITLDLQNVFDRRSATNLDEVYTDDAVRPIEGGSYSDLVFLKNEAGAPARRRTAFQLPTAFQAPLAVSLGVHQAF